MFVVVFVFVILVLAILGCDKLPEKSSINEESSVNNEKAKTQYSCEDFMKNGFAKGISDRLSHVCEEIIGTEHSFYANAEIIGTEHSFYTNAERCLQKVNIRIRFSLCNVDVIWDRAGVLWNCVAWVSDHLNIDYHKVNDFYVRLTESEVESLKRAICKISDKWRLYDGEVFLNKCYWEYYINKIK